MIFYVLLAHGAKPSGPLRNHPAARTQLVQMNAVIDRESVKKVDLIFDYARRIDSLSSLPKLEWLLTQMSLQGEGLTFIDDLSRLFRKTSLEKREALFSELSAYGRHLFSIRHNKKLSAFSPLEKNVLIYHAEKLKPLARQRRNRDTGKARAASLEARQQRSVEISRQIKKLQGDLQDTEGSATLQMVADGANALGMRTATGKAWTRQTVGRALDTNANTSSRN